MDDLRTYDSDTTVMPLIDGLSHCDCATKLMPLVEALTARVEALEKMITVEGGVLIVTPVQQSSAENE